MSTFAIPLRNGRGARDERYVVLNASFKGKFIEVIKDKQHIERYALYDKNTAKSVNSFEYILFVRIRCIK